MFFSILGFCTLHLLGLEPFVLLFTWGWGFPDPHPESSRNHTAEADYLWDVTQPTYFPPGQ